MPWLKRETANRNEFSPGALAPGVLWFPKEQEELDRLVVLGTGAAIITKYYNTCFVLDDGNEYFLIDGGGGGGVLRQFQEAGLDWTRLRRMFISHAHTDHIFGFVWALRRVAHLMGMGKFDGELSVYGHGELLEDVRGICGISFTESDFRQLERRIVFEPIGNNEARTIGPYEVIFFDILSTKMKQFAFQLTLTNGKKLVFLGDEPCDEANLYRIQGCDWLLAEAYCLYEDREKYTPYKFSHNTVMDSCIMAENAGAKNLILWHTTDGYYGHRKELYTKEGSRYYRGKLHVPDDLEVIALD
jgi:ribonuclease Z